MLPALLLASSLVGLCPALREAQGAAPVASEGPAPPEPVVLQADEAGVILEWRAPAFSQRQVTGEDGRSYNVLEALGWAQAEVPGQPQLPFASALAVVPPTGDVTLHVQVLERDRRPLSHPVVPAPKPMPVGSPPTGVGWAWARDERAYTEAGPHPADVVTLEEAGWMRGRRLVRLTFFPLRFDPTGPTLRPTADSRSPKGPALEVARRVRVELRFDSVQDKATGTGERVSDDPFTPVLQHAVVNPAQVTRLVRPERSAAASPALVSPSSAQGGGSRYKLIISREGVYELTYSTLVAAGIPVATTPRTAYRLEHAGEEVAYQWEGDGDAVFEPGERILFYAHPTFTRFADHDVYWLTVGANGTQMAVRTGDPAGLPAGTAWAIAVAEQGEGSQHYLSQYPSEWNSDRWYWDRLYWDYVTGTGERDKDFSIGLFTPDGGAPNATLRVYMQSTTSSDSVNPDHRVQVWLNGSLLGTAEWDGGIYHVATFYPAASLLQAASNTVRLRLPGTGASSGVEEVWLDAIELRYGVSAFPGDHIRVEGETGQRRYTVGDFNSDSVRIYDVTSLTVPQVVTGFTASVGSVIFGDADTDTATYYLLAEEQIAAPDEIVKALTLADPPDGADYLIIAHSEFMPAVAPLADHRASEGLNVFSVAVETVYDAYGDGRADPLAIRDYISHTYHSEEPPTLSYVLLVGDGTKEGTDGQWIPPYMVTIDPQWPGDWDPFDAASDNRFVTMDGPDDRTPDVSIGRLPVNTITETTTVVDKILSYELDPPPWPWNERMLFFADNPETNAPFHQDSDDVYDTLPATSTGQRVYYCTQDCSELHLYDDINDAHDATVRELNIGGLLASYVGHGSEHQWAAERMFHWDDVVGNEANNLPPMHNGRALPMFLEMACYTSDFSYPAYDTLDESLLRLAGGGAIATWGSTALGTTSGHNVLHEGFFNAVFGDGITELGPATHAAKLLLSEGPSNHDLLDTFILFGDPAMDLNLTVAPWMNGLFLPITMQGS